MVSVLDKIFLHGIKCDCVIGVWAWEKQIRQTLVLDIDMATDITAAAKSDDLKDALNYNKVAERVIEFAEASQFELLEVLVERIAEIIMKEFNVPWVRIRLDKGPAVKNVKQVGIEMERGSKG